MAKALAVHMGKIAAARIAERGWSADLFSLLLGASGGPKWIILGHLDRVLFGDFLQRSDQPLSVIGSSIGSWRHACLAMSDPVAAIDRLEEGYLYQRYRSKPSAAEVSTVSHQILAGVLGEQGKTHLVNHPRIRSHIVTARGRGATAAASPPLLAAGMGIAALSNTLSRRLLSLHFQRVVFHSGSQAYPNLDLMDFQTHYCALHEHNVAQTLHASGAIPFVLRGEQDIRGAPSGQYWDGGIIDYHFDLHQYHGDGLILYPHFSANVIPGWFDKPLHWRRATIENIDKLVLLCPTAELIADLPLSKIPDRSDFTRLGEEERIRYWEHCVQRSRALAEEFMALIEGSDPLAGVTLIN